jgi:hypothetical protein
MGLHHRTRAAIGGPGSDGATGAAVNGSRRPRRPPASGDVATTAVRPSGDPRSHQLLTLQRTVGNRVVGSMLATPRVPTRRSTTAADGAAARAGEPPVIVDRPPLQRRGGGDGAFLGADFRPVNEMGIVYQETGANLRDRPAPEAEGSRVIGHLGQNTKVFVLGHDQDHGWLSVSTTNAVAGHFGYVADWLVWRRLPDPGADVTRIRSGDYPLLIAGRHYKGKGFNVWGRDLRYVVNALVYANNDIVHNGTGEPGLRKIDDDVTKAWFYARATADVFIWLPSPAFLRSLYDTVVAAGGGTGSISGDLWQAVKKGLEVLAYGAAFVGGLVHGFGTSVYDAGKAIVDLLVSVFTGEVLNDAREIWHAISNLTWDDIRDGVGEWAEKWGAKLESSDPFKAGHAHGYLTGYVMGEAAMLLFSGGTLAALKGAAWAGRLGRLGQALKGVKAVERLAAGIERARRLGGDRARRLARRANAVLLIRPGDIRALLRRHIKVRDPSVPRRRGIGGAHDMAEFARHASEYSVVSRAPHASVRGVYKIEYRMYALDATGAPTTTLRRQVLQKTVYDPAVWPDDKLTRTVVEAARDAVTNGRFGREWTGTSTSGIRIRGYQSNNKVTSFFFD